VEPVGRRARRRSAQAGNLRDERRALRRGDRDFHPGDRAQARFRRRLEQARHGLLSRGRIPALADCDEVIKRNPSHFGALSGYAQIYLRLDRPDKALEFFRRALAVNPNLDGVQAAIDRIEAFEARRRARSI
jgi:Tfp pilus assembly protein PilF